MQFNKVQQFILQKLENELSDDLTYHNVGHVIDVYESVLRHIEVNELTEEEKVLLKTAALFHDAGFIEQAAGHEEISCSFAEKYLPNFGYSEQQIAAICGMIMATKIPQLPANKLEMILADSDLDYLGRNDFFIISNNLFLELKAAGVIKDEDQWNRLQVDFFERHRYFTTEAKHWRDEKKAEHLLLIKNKISGNNESN